MGKLAKKRMPDKALSQGKAIVRNKDTLFYLEKIR